MAETVVKRLCHAVCSKARHPLTGMHGRPYSCHRYSWWRWFLEVQCWKRLVLRRTHPGKCVAVNCCSVRRTARKQDTVLPWKHNWPCLTFILQSAWLTSTDTPYYRHIHTTFIKLNINIGWLSNNSETTCFVNMYTIIKPVISTLFRSRI